VLFQRVRRYEKQLASFFDSTNDCGLAFICGDADYLVSSASRVARESFADSASGDNHLDIGEKQVIIRHHLSLNLPGFDCFCEATESLRLWERLVTAGATPADPLTHELLRVEAGWPVMGVDMDENRFVVEVGRGTQAICYTKGCFLGQEPIVMARDRGQVNRLLLGILCGAGPALAAGTKLLQGDAEVGQVTSSVESPRLGQTIALAYVRRGSQEPGTKLMIEPERQATVCALPFA